MGETAWVLAETALLERVDEAFAAGPLGEVSWPDPNPSRSASDEAYSRFTDPAKWRVVGARVDAWLDALADARLVAVERGVAIEWAKPIGPNLARVDSVVPFAAGAIPLIVGRMELGGISEAGVILGCGAPVMEIERFPDCGCDACDSGSLDELEHLDTHMRGIVTGRFRHLSRSGAMVMTVGDGGRASGLRRPLRIEHVLANPTGWHEISGASWLT